jgi:hypothetical protein
MLNLFQHLTGQANTTYILMLSMWDAEINSA